MPSSVAPMLPMPIKLPFSDPEWVFEPKLDGFRALCFLKDGKVRFISRNRRNLTQRFPELQEIRELIKAKTAIIDGEIVALDRRGGTPFSAHSVFSRDVARSRSTLLTPSTLMAKTYPNIRW